MVAKTVDVLDITTEPVHPKIVAAREAYRNEFGSLLAHRRANPMEKWVAYHGEFRIGIGTSKLQLVRECQKRGLHLAECLIVGIDQAVLNPNE